jgi:ribonuclease HI
LASWDKPTNNVAELRAAIRAIQIVKEEGLQNII